MRARAALLILAAGAIGCGDDGAEPPAEAMDRRPESPPSATTTVGPWRITAEVDPSSIGPLETSVESLDARSSRSKADRAPFVRGKLRFENTSGREVLLKPIDHAAFSKDDMPGDQLMIAEGQCGYGQNRPGAPVHPGACTLALLPPTRIEPGASEAKSFALFSGLPGMAALDAGRYEFPRTVRLRPAGKPTSAAPLRTTSTLVVQIAPD
jgi:hypothetical protein